MRRIFLAGCLSLALVGAAVGQPLTGYTNFGYVSTQFLVIDATNVVNLGLFDINISGSTAQPFDFSDVLTYTNRNIMFCDNGFLFNDSPASFGNIGPSVNFINQNPGQIYAGAAVLPGTFSLSLSATGTSPLLIISATNITNSGVLQVGQSGDMQVIGSSLDLSHGSAVVEGFDQISSGLITGGTELGPGEFVQLWGSGFQTNGFNAGNFSLSGASTPTSNITNNDLTTGTFSLSLFGANFIAYTNELNPSNFVTQVVLYVESNPGQLTNFTESAFFVPAAGSPLSTNTPNFQNVVVQWTVQVTNSFGQIVNESLYLTDDLGNLPTNVTEVTNNKTLTGLVQLVPTNYTLQATFRGGAALTNTGNVTNYSTSLFNTGFGTNGTGIGGVTNEYSTFEVNLAPVTAQPDASVAGSTFSNVPGRMEISAGQSLNLTGSIIDAGNYLGLYSTNHYAGSQGAAITFPYADINLGSTNGQMAITNLVVPYLTRFTGQVSAWSTIWTNLTSSNSFATNSMTNGTVVSNTITTNVFTVTNLFMVTMVGSTLDPFSTPNIENLALRSTNVVISDNLVVNQSLLINAQNLTITSNAPGDLTATGMLNFTPPDQSDLYSAVFPSMQNFTNSGSFETENAVFFQTRQNPNFPSAGDGPWQSFVNNGTIISDSGGITVWANNVLMQNSSTIEAGFGPLFVTASTAVITNTGAPGGELLADEGDMSLTGGSLTINDESLQCTGFLDLAATSLLTDLSPASTATSGFTGNSWTAGDGFSLLTAPTSATNGLLGTSITSSCRSNAICQNIWAGKPVVLTGGLTPTNDLPLMANNVPLGLLVLDGGNNNSVYHFAGPDQVNPYAMYVSQIQLVGGAENQSGSGAYTAFSIDTNVTIYFLDAIKGFGQTDISAALNGQAGGHLVWLSNYISHFSVVDVTYTNTAHPNVYIPQTQIFPVNPGYVAAYGLPPEPLTPQTIALVIGTTNVSSTTMAAISWYAPAYSTNTLYYRTLTNPSWQVRTNFVEGATSQRVGLNDPMTQNRLYRVTVAPQ